MGCLGDAFLWVWVQTRQMGWMRSGSQVRPRVAGRTVMWSVIAVTRARLVPSGQGVEPLVCGCSAACGDVRGLAPTGRSSADRPGIAPHGQRHDHGEQHRDHRERRHDRMLQ